MEKEKSKNTPTVADDFHDINNDKIKAVEKRTEGKPTRIKSFSEMVDYMQNKEESNSCNDGLNTGEYVDGAYLSLDKMDWLKDLNKFSFINSHIKKYQEELVSRLSSVDMEISDILHYVELYDLNDTQGLKAMDMLRECREKRREVKDEMYITDCYQKALGDSQTIKK